MPILAVAIRRANESEKEATDRAHAVQEKLAQAVNFFDDDCALVEAGVIRKLEIDSSFSAEAVAPFVEHFRRAIAEILTAAPSAYGPMVAAELYAPDMSKAESPAELLF